MSDLAVKQVKVNPRSLLEQSWYYSSTHCYLSNFKATGPLFPKKRLFKGFYYEQAWCPYQSCDLDCLNKVLLLQPKEAVHEVLLQLVASEKMFETVIL